MKTLLSISFLFISICIYPKGPTFFDSTKCTYLGTDLSQLNNYRYKQNTGIHFGLNGHYKVYKQFSLTSSLYYNDINRNLTVYKNIKDYRSQGYCFKLGVQSGFKIKEGHSRLSMVFGFNYAKVKFRESGSIQSPESYWGDYFHTFRTPLKNADCTELNAGFQIDSKDFGFKVLLYAMIDSYGNKWLRDDDIAENYKSWFVPGYGYFKHGINLMVFAKLNNL